MGKISTYTIQETFRITEIGVVMLGILGTKDSIVHTGDHIEFTANGLQRKRKVYGIDFSSVNSDGKPVGLLIKCENEAEIEELRNWEPNGTEAVIWREEVTIKLWVDFNASVELSVRLNSAGTLEDLKRQNAQLKEGQKLLLWCEDEDKDGNPTDIVVEAVAKYNTETNTWEGVFDWRQLTNKSKYGNV